MAQPPCYDGCGRPAEGYSAYCGQCQARHRDPRPIPPASPLCLCAGCGEMFANRSTFDRHQSQGETTVCHDPASLGLVRDGAGTWATPAGLAARAAVAGRLPRSRTHTGTHAA